MAQFVLAVLSVELTPGPNMAYLATLALARGDLGVALGLSVHALVTYLGLDNYYFYIRGFMKSFDGLAWPIYCSLLGKGGKPKTMRG